jgi:hypothetical protein
MRSDRPIIAAILSLAAGLGLIFAYGNGTTNLSAAYPLTGSSLHMDLTTTGAAAVGGLAFVALGLLLLTWALLAAIVGQVSLLAADRPKERVAVKTHEKLT